MTEEERWDEAIAEVRAVSEAHREETACAHKEKIQQILNFVKEYTRGIFPYKFLDNGDGYSNVAVNHRDELLLGLATLVIHLMEREA